MKFFLRTIVLMLLIFGGIVFGITKFTNTNSPDPIDSTADPLPTDVAYQGLTYSAWIPDWAPSDGLESFKANSALFDSISPVWYYLEEDGSLRDEKPSNYEEVLNYAQSKEIDVVPAIALFDHEIFTSVLQNEENFNRHIAEIIAEVETHDYAGIDLDYESTKLADKDKYFEMLEILSEEMHKRDKTLVVTVLSKWGDDVVYPSLPETRQVQDWTKISDYADEVRIMAYDYTFSKAKYPGPIAPLFWIKDILDYAEEKIPSSKIVLGIHLYSYEWYQEIANTNENTDDLLFQPTFGENPGNRKTSVRSYTYDTVQRVLKSYQGELRNYEGEKIYTYQKVNDSTNILERRVLVFIDNKGVAARAQLAKDYRIKGVVFWRLGKESSILDSL